MRTFIIVILALILGGGGTFLWLYYGGFNNEKKEAMSFIDAYGNYSEIADAVEKLVNLPGTEGNRDRAELFSLLTSILTEKMEPVKRERLARLAYSNLDTIKKEIDTAQLEQAKLYQVIQEFDNASRSFSSIVLQNRSKKIITLARKRAELTARITSVLSETNEQTYAIITRILQEKGDLSEAHIKEINASTEYAEKRFHSLESLYKELLEKKKEMEDEFNEFVKVAI